MRLLSLSTGSKSYLGPNSVLNHCYFAFTAKLVMFLNKFSPKLWDKRHLYVKITPLWSHFADKWHCMNHRWHQAAFDTPGVCKRHSFWTQVMVHSIIQTTMWVQKTISYFKMHLTVQSRSFCLTFSWKAMIYNFKTC